MGPDSHLSFNVSPENLAYWQTLCVIIVMQSLSKMFMFKLKDVHVHTFYHDASITGTVMVGSCWLQQGVILGVKTYILKISSADG